MVDIIAWVCVGGAVISFVMGVVEWAQLRTAKTKVKDAAQKAGAVATDQNESAQNLERHAGIDFKGQWEALAALAKALKDLDASTRFMVLSLAFLGVAGGTLGLDAIGTGLGAA